MERAVADAPDHQVSLTDPDARAMATNGKGTGMVGYNVQAVVDAKHHLIIAHEVTNVGHDRSQLANMARHREGAILGWPLYPPDVFVNGRHCCTLLAALHHDVQGN
jgi:hypothetical protein